MGLELVEIVAYDLNGAWFKCIEELMERGRCWTVEQGSFEGQRRWELDHVRIHVTHPGTRPLVPSVPQGIPCPADDAYIDRYLPYLMTDEKQPGEQYTYGERIVPQLPVVVEMLRRSFGTNQACIEVGRPEDVQLHDPPCLRLIDFRVFSREALRDGEAQALHMTVYFRSWDLWGGFPCNMAGLRLLQEDVARELEVEAGEIVAISKGLHIYEPTWDLARLLGCH